jgi:hypothetical protein
MNRIDRSVASTLVGERDQRHKQAFIFENSTRRSRTESFLEFTPITADKSRRR